MIPAADRFGRWSDDIGAAEQLTRLRSLRAISRPYCGLRGDHLADILHLSERDTGQLPAALATLDALAPLDRRAVLASFAQLHRPLPEAYTA